MSESGSRETPQHWADLDQGPASSAQMIEWYAPETFALIRGIPLLAVTRERVLAILTTELRLDSSGTLEGLVAAAHRISDLGGVKIYEVVPASSGADTMADNWIEDEFDRATERTKNLPSHALPVITRPLAQRNPAVATEVPVVSLAGSENGLTAADVREALAVLRSRCPHESLDHQSNDFASWDECTDCGATMNGEL